MEITYLIRSFLERKQGTECNCSCKIEGGETGYMKEDRVLLYSWWVCSQFRDQVYSLLVLQSESLPWWKHLNLYSILLWYLSPVCRQWLSFTDCDDTKFVIAYSSKIKGGGWVVANTVSDLLDVWVKKW